MEPGDSGFDRYCRELLELRRDGFRPRNLILLRSVDSTQRICRRFVQEYLSEEEPVPQATVVAYEQTAGLGRQGRSWKSPAGSGAYVTQVRTVAQGALLARLPLLVGFALAQAVGDWVDGPCRLKWPNDLLVAGRKIGGILIDGVSRPGEGSVVCLGFGVNRGRRGVAPPLPEATSLVREAARGGTGEVPSLARLTHSLLVALEAAWPRLEDAEWLVSQYREASAHRPGDRLSCRVAGKRREGTFRGFDSQGRLLLEAGDRVEALSSGEVFAVADTEEPE